MSALRRILYFLLGVAFACAVFAAIMRWDSYHEFQLRYRARELFAPLDQHEFRMEDLVGTWTGKESWGTTYIIIRRSDGTFSEAYDPTHADVPHPKYRSSGRWAIEGAQYAYFHTQSTRPSLVRDRIWMRTLRKVSRREFEYMEEEGDGVIEKKQ